MHACTRTHTHSDLTFNKLGENGYMEGFSSPHSHHRHLKHLPSGPWDSFGELLGAHITALPGRRSQLTLCPPYPGLGHRTTLRFSQLVTPMQLPCITQDPALKTNQVAPTTHSLESKGLPILYPANNNLCRPAFPNFSTPESTWAALPYCLSLPRPLRNNWKAPSTLQGPEEAAIQPVLKILPHLAP